MLWRKVVVEVEESMGLWWKVEVQVEATWWLKIRGRIRDERKKAEAEAEEEEELMKRWWDYCSVLWQHQRH